MECGYNSVLHILLMVYHQLCYIINWLLVVRDKAEQYLKAAYGSFSLSVIAAIIALADGPRWPFQYFGTHLILIGSRLRSIQAVFSVVIGEHISASGKLELA